MVDFKADTSGISWSCAGNVNDAIGSRDSELCRVLARSSSEMRVLTRLLTKISAIVAPSSQRSSFNSNSTTFKYHQLVPVSN